MVNDATNAIKVRLLLPETLWLEPEHYQQARELSQQFHQEQEQWQAYLMELGKGAFADWLKERCPAPLIHNPLPNGEDINGLQIGEFNCYLIAAEHFLDDVVPVPRLALEQPGRAAHFYVVLEVLEDQEQVVMQGFLRHDELMAWGGSALKASTADVWPFPLTIFDTEMNHLVVYLQHIDPSAIPLPAVAPAATLASSSTEPGAVRTHLSQWLQGVLEEGWQTLEALVNPAANLAWSTRHTSLGTRGGKLINFGLQLGHQTVVLLMTVTPESEGKIGIGAQVLPAGGDPFLPPQVKLTLLANASDKILQEVESREQDNYIQLKPFKGKPGIRFTIEVSLNDIHVREIFEL